MGQMIDRTTRPFLAEKGSRGDRFRELRSRIVTGVVGGDQYLVEPLFSGCGGPPVISTWLPAVDGHMFALRNPSIGGGMVRPSTVAVAWANVRLRRVC